MKMERMKPVKWHGYEQRVTSHPGMPWWVLLFSYTERKAFWLRSDSEHVHEHRVYCGEELGEEGPAESYTDALALYDIENPIPVPPPVCGQVWALIEGGEAAHQEVVTVVDRRGVGIVYIGTRSIAIDRDWPPAGCVLVSGQGSPWAPMRLAERRVSS